MGTGLLTKPRPSLVGLKTGARKLNGQVYTPLPLARAMLETVAWSGRGRLLDPTCGDGVFLEAAIRKVAALTVSAEEKREIVRERIAGWDLDAEAIAGARERLGRVLAEIGLGEAMPALEVRDALDARADETVDCIVGNPPYLEAKRMPDALKKRVRARCPLAGRGAFDLYTAILERCAAMLDAGRGELCFLVPNRFLVVSYAAALRRHLLERFDVEVRDLSREKVFDGAAVYPIVLRLSRTPGEPRYRVRRDDDVEAGGATGLDARVLADRLGGLLPLPPAHPGGTALLERVLGSERLVPLGELAEIRWSVSFHRAGLRDRYVFASRPDSPHARRFLGGGRFAGNREVRPFGIEWAGAWIDYDEARARVDANPLPPLGLFDTDKLVVCQNARRARVAVDRDRLVLKDIFLAALPRAGEPALLEWLAIVLGSDLVHYLYEHLFGGTRKNGGYLHFLPRYLAPLPVPPVPDADAVRGLHASLARGEPRHTDAEAMVREAYGVRPAEARALDAYRYPERRGAD